MIRPAHGKGFTSPSIMTPIIVWSLVALWLMGVRMGWQVAPGLSQDTFQYFSAARNALEGFMGDTSLVHFDAERRFGTIPAPLVTFPMGLPFILAAFSLLGMSMPMGIIVVNTLSVFTCIVALTLAMHRLALGSMAIHLTLGAFVLNGTVGWLLGFGVTEPPFMATITVAVLLLVCHAQDRLRTRHAVRAGILLGLAYHLRYAGLFVVVALAGLTLLTLVQARWQHFRHYLIAFVVATPFLLAGLIRNSMLVGNWRGGNDKQVLHPLGRVAFDTLLALDNLFLGQRIGWQDNLTHAAAILLAMGLLALLVKDRLAHRAATALPNALIARQCQIAQDLGVIVLGYSACMFYAGLTTVISYGVRMFMPVICILFVALACWIVGLRSSLQHAQPSPGHRPQPLVKVALLALCLAYAAASIPPSIARQGQFGSKEVAQALNAPDDKGRTALQVIKDFGARPRIMSNEGPRVDHVLALPTISMVSLEFSSHEWTVAYTLETINRFGINLLVIKSPSSPADEQDQDLIPSEFVRELTQGRHPPWLKPLFSQGGMTVYAVTGT